MASGNRPTEPETRCARSGDVSIAYQVIGEGFAANPEEIVAEIKRFLTEAWEEQVPGEWRLFAAER